MDICSTLSGRTKPSSVTGRISTSTATEGFVSFGGGVCGSGAAPFALLPEIEVARRLLLEPETIVLRRVLEELGRLREHVLLAPRLLRWLPRRRLVDVRVLHGRVPHRRIVDRGGLERRVRWRGWRLCRMAENGVWGML